MMRGAFISAVLLLALCAPARADECDNAVTTVDMQNCQTEKLVTLNTELSMRYKKRQEIASGQDKAAKAGGDKNHLKLLKSSQDAFDAYQKAECKRQAYMFNGGTLESVAAGACLKTMTQRRIEDMKVWPTPEGDN